MTEQNLTNFSERCEKIFNEISRDVIGQKEVVEGSVIAMIAGGNVLLEGVPGVGKTRLVRTLGRVFDMPFSRIQFTPDLMPADVTGTNIIVKDDNGNSKFEFQKGPVFSNIILADEINRATPKTQSALLEAMQEHTVTVMGVSHKLDDPFFVLATQNPIEQDGTYPLPEAQMDRFMFKLLVPQPDLADMINIVSMTQKTMAEVSEAVCNAQTLLEMRRTANEIPVAEEVLRYAMTLCLATHSDGECASTTAKKYIRLGASPRAGQALISAAKVRALMHGRYNVSYEDLNVLALPVLRHRMKLNFEAISERISPDELIQSIIEELNGKKATVLSKKDRAEKKEQAETQKEETPVEEKSAKRKFGRK